jgi:DUF4097 and DUF4098 domain-containing protein YvlB
MPLHRKILIAIPFAGTLAFAAVLTGPNGSQTLQKDFDSSDVEKLMVENTSGKTTVTKTAGPRVEITAVKRKPSAHCTIDAEKSEFGEVIVKVEKPITETCDVDVEIKIPEQTDLSLWTGSGPVTVSGIEGKLSVNSGSGSLLADGRFSNVIVKSGSGSIEVSGIRGGGKISAGNGSMNLKFLEGARGTLDVTSGSGDQNYLFPRNAKLNAKLMTGSGDIHNEIDNHEAADLNLNVKAGSGDLSIKAF